MTRRAQRIAVLISVGLLLTITGCKTAEDRPDTDPLNDPWLDAIETGDEETPAAATPTPDPTVDPALEPTTAVPNPDGLELPPDAASAAATAEPAEGSTAKPAKLAGATKPSNSGAASDAPAEAAPPPGEQPADVPGEQPAAVPAPAEAAPPPKPAEPAPPPPITIADYDGTFRFSGGSAQRQGLTDAIEFGASQVAGIIRGIARKRLTKTQIIDDEIKMSVSGDKITFNWSNGSTMTCVVGGPKVSMSFKGDKYLGRVLRKGSKMIIVFDASDATKTLVYVLSSDRQRLTVHHKLNADQLDEPVTFKLSYTRK